MKPSELKERISIRIEPPPIGYRHTIVEGRIMFTQSHCINQDSPNHNEAVEMLKEHIKESLCRIILGDRYAEFMDALLELRRNCDAVPGRMQASNNAFERMEQLIETLKD